MSDPQTLIRMQVMWNRLVAVVEEQAQALLRTAFGAVVREAGDLSAGVYDLEGRMLAQAVTGTPGHVNTMAMAVGHFLECFPVEAMRPGDVFFTNDPWLGTGHLFDFVVVTPAFRNGTIVALFASTCHLTDVGGRGFTAEASSVLEEGVRFPIMKLRDEGRIRGDLIAILEANSRNAVEARGDLLSLVSCNDVGCERLCGMMDELGVERIEPLAAFIFERSGAATREAIRKLPNGRYRHHMDLDGWDFPVRLEASMVIEDERVIIDFAGSSKASRYGINSPKCYTDAYTIFGLKCLIAPHIPNNAASLAPFEVRAEPGSIVHPLDPSPVTARHVIGQMLPDLAMGCLAEAVPGLAPGESAGSIWVLAMSSVHGRVAEDLSGGERFNTMNVAIGGMGARPGKHGLSATAFPSGVGAIPVEVTEHQSPLVFWRKELLEGSGGSGRWRGGDGQIIEIGSVDDRPFCVSAATFDRTAHPARGREGGSDGQTGAARLASGAVLEGKGVHIVPAGDRLVVETPGGGGCGEG
ncbi:MAG: hydantoinase B/oxoprolinase family protein [Geminicoccaceae bacterium]